MLCWCVGPFLHVLVCFCCCLSTSEMANIMHFLQIIIMCACNMEFNSKYTTSRVYLYNIFECNRAKYSSSKPFNILNIDAFYFASSCTTFSHFLNDCCNRRTKLVNSQWVSSVSYCTHIVIVVAFAHSCTYSVFWPCAFDKNSTIW